MVDLNVKINQLDLSNPVVHSATDWSIRIWFL